MTQNMPHDGVYVRLGLSKVHGVGVIAIIDIPKETNIFENDLMEVLWIKKSDFDSAKMEPEQRKLYKDFCIFKNGMIGVPKNFNSITPGWFINEPGPNMESNVYADKDYNFFALRDIKQGEELYVKYETFSEHLERY
jgi:hypothetical protein